MTMLRASPFAEAPGRMKHGLGGRLDGIDEPDRRGQADVEA